MAGARGDALEWALALASAPAERHVLRQRPLPDGIEVVLQVAGGSQGPVMVEVTRRTGMSSAELVEATRFYLREVLFFPEADAYRVLGLTADASDERIKLHHRLLQQWLHPDRPASDWDAAFAARVNAAWSQLRSAERRAAYSSRPVPVDPRPVAASNWSPPPGLSPAGFETEPDRSSVRWRRRAPVLALFGVCAILGFLVLRDMQRGPSDALVEVDANEADASGESVALRLPSRVGSEPAPIPEVIAAAPDAVRTGNAKGLVAAEIEPPPKSQAGNVQTLMKPLSAPRAIRTIPDDANASAGGEAASPGIDVGSRASRSAEPVPEPAPAPFAPPPSSVSVDGVTQMQGPVATRGAAIARAATAQPSGDVESHPPASAPTPTKSRVHGASRQQVALAEQTGGRLLAYVTGRGGGIPPIWANLAVQNQAGRVRAALADAGRMRVGLPAWRIGDEVASMNASFTSRTGESRSLRVELVWRERQWLVSNLEFNR